MNLRRDHYQTRWKFACKELISTEKQEASLVSCCCESSLKNRRSRGVSSLTRDDSLFLPLSFAKRRITPQYYSFDVKTTKLDTTVAGGSLGWWIDEERSEIR